MTETSVGVDPAPPSTRRRRLAWTLLVAGLIGLACAVILMVEKLAVVADPAYVPSCSISPLVSCGSVMTSPQAEALGVPNPLLGIVGFSVVVTVGAGLLAGATFARWFMLGLLGGCLLGLVFVHWLIYQSLYRIGALCPYCVAVWAATIVIFWYVALATLNERPTAYPAAWAGIVELLTRYHSLVVVCWFGLIAIATLHAFWGYWTL